MRVLRVIREFWRVVRAEGWYGGLDVLSFWYLDDWCVPHRWFTGCTKPCGKYGHDVHVCPPPCTLAHASSGWWITAPSTSSGSTDGLFYCGLCYSYHRAGACTTTVTYGGNVQ